MATHVDVGGLGESHEIEDLLLNVIADNSEVSGSCSTERPSRPITLWEMCLEVLVGSS
jgi:hypothetical protein